MNYLRVSMLRMQPTLKVQIMNCEAGIGPHGKCNDWRDSTLKSLH